MTRRIYHNVEPIARADAEAALRSGDPSKVCNALVGIAFHDPDWQWVQHWCLRLIDDPDSDVRGLAATCLGHIARIHKTLDESLARGVLERVRECDKDPKVRGRAEDALGDLDLFLRHVDRDRA
jgi:hypothetical protein